MSLQKKIEDKLSQSLKNKEKNTFPTLRLIISAIKDVKIAKKIKEGNLGDADVVSILKKMVKQRNDSCEAYKNAGREDLLKSEKSEIEIINQFLPKQLSEQETTKICEEVIKKTSANSMKDMGKVMGVLKSEHGEVLDFSIVSKIIKQLLNK
tara:strand:- start:3150 stop:3605 length:456 start_codon:yes stop_codon:yes gene_type:complete